MAHESAVGPHLDMWLNFGVWEGFQSIGNCLEIDLDEFSTRGMPYLSISTDFEKFRFCLLKFRGPDVLSRP